MIAQNIELQDWGWDVSVFYDVTPNDANAVLLVLEMTGCDGRTLRRAERNLRSGFLNTGLTYTNPEVGQTIMVIGRTDSPEQFWNTLDHEKGHAVMHIAGAKSISHQGEEYQYLSGALCQQLYPVAKMFICGRCSD